MIQKKWLQNSVFALVAGISVLSVNSAGAATHKLLRVDTPTALEKCGGTIVFRQELSHFLKFSDIEKCSNVEIESSQRSFKLAGSHLRHGNIKISNDIRGSQVTLKSNSGRHSAHFRIPQKPGLIHFDSHSSCRGTVELIKTLITTVSVENARRCDTVIIENTETHKEMDSFKLQPYGRHQFGGNPSFVMNEQSPSRYKISVASSDRRIKDQFIPEIDCEYEATTAALQKVGASEIYRTSITILPEGLSRKGNLKFTAIVPAYAARSNEAQRMEIVARPGTCEILNH